MLSGKNHLNKDEKEKYDLYHHYFNTSYKRICSL